VLSRLALLVLLVGCAESATVTAPAPGDVPRAARSTENTWSTNAGTLAPRVAVAAATADALTRLLPSLEAEGQTPHTRALGAALSGLATALEHPGVPHGPALAPLERALAALETAAADRPGELAELAAVRLVLDRAAALAP
jgi:hypothetical protein